MNQEANSEKLSDSQSNPHPSEQPQQSFDQGQIKQQDKSLQQLVHSPTEGITIAPQLAEEPPHYPANDIKPQYTQQPLPQTSQVDRKIEPQEQAVRAQPQFQTEPQHQNEITQEQLQAQEDLLIPEGQYQYQEGHNLQEEQYEQDISNEEEQNFETNEEKQENKDQNFHQQETTTEKSIAQPHYQQIPIEQYTEADLFVNHPTCQNNEHSNLEFIGVEYQSTISQQEQQVTQEETHPLAPFKEQEAISTEVIQNNVQIGEEPATVEQIQAYPADNALADPKPEAIQPSKQEQPKPSTIEKPIQQQRKEIPQQSQAQTTILVKQESNNISQGDLPITPYHLPQQNFQKKKEKRPKHNSTKSKIPSPQQNKRQTSVKTTATTAVLQKNHPQPLTIFKSTQQATIKALPNQQKNNLQPPVASKITKKNTQQQKIPPQTERKEAQQSHHQTISCPKPSISTVSQPILPAKQHQTKLEQQKIPVSIPPSIPQDSEDSDSDELPKQSIQSIPQQKIQIENRQTAAQSAIFHQQPQLPTKTELPKKKKKKTVKKHHEKAIRQQPHHPQSVIELKEQHEEEKANTPRRKSSQQIKSNPKPPLAPIAHRQKQPDPQMPNISSDPVEPQFPPLTSQLIALQAYKERMGSTYNLFLKYVANYQKALFHYKLVVENVTSQINNRKNKKNLLKSLLNDYFSGYAKLNREFQEQCNNTHYQDSSTTNNPFGNIKLELKSGFQELINIRRAVAAECIKIDSYTINHIVSSIEKAFAIYFQKITTEQLKQSQRRQLHAQRQKTFLKVIGQISKTFIKGIAGTFKTDALAELARFVNQEATHRQFLRNYGKGVLPLRQTFIQAEKELFQALQHILNRFKTESKTIYSVGQRLYTHLEDISSAIKQNSKFDQISPITDIDYIRYVLQKQEKTEHRVFKTKHFQRYLDLTFFDTLVGNIRLPYKGAICKIFPMSVGHEELIHTISGNLVHFNRDTDHCLNVFIIKNINARIIGQGTVQFDELLKGIIFDDSRTVRLKLKDSDRAQELICYLNQKEEDFVVEEVPHSAR